MRIKLLLFGVLSIFLTPVWAYDFQVDGLCYKIQSSANTVELTNGPNISSVSIPETVSYDNVEYTVTSIGNSAFMECSALTSVEIPNSVTYIGESAFQVCSGITSISLPNSLTGIGASAFYRCNGLTAIIIPNTVTYIANGAFSGCSGLTSVTLSNSLTTIGNASFLGCSSLTSINLPSNLSAIGDAFFGGCNSLTAFVVNGDNNNFSSENGVLFNKDKTILIRFPQGLKGNYTIPNTTVTIGKEAFQYCSKLDSVSFSHSVTSISNLAFYDCSGLTSVSLPNSVTSIGDNAFKKCSGLTSIKLPDSLASINEWVFSNCIALTSIILPNSVKSIGDNAFLGCSGLTSINLSKSLISIGTSAFSICAKLDSITIPNTVTNIGYHAFLGCQGLSSIHANAPEPIDLLSSVFDGVDNTTCTLYVPQGSVEKYRQSAYWGNFKTIVVDKLISGMQDIEEDEFGFIYNASTGELIIKNVEKAVHVQIYDSNGKLRYNNSSADGEALVVGSLHKGLYLVRMNIDNRNFTQKLMITK